MAQFDVYRNTDEASSYETPYFIDIQHDIVSELPTRIVIPLYFNIKKIDKLHQVFIIEEQHVILATQRVVSVPKYLLDDKVTNFKQHRDEIIASVDFLITGF